MARRTNGTRRLCWVAIFPIANSETFQEFCEFSGRKSPPAQKTKKTGGNPPKKSERTGKGGQEEKWCEKTYFAWLPSFQLLVSTLVVMSGDLKNFQFTKRNLKILKKSKKNQKEQTRLARRTTSGRRILCLAANWFPIARWVC